MKKKSILSEKSFQFSLAIIELCKHLKETKTAYALNNQLLRSGTAVGALVREAEYAQSKADFINKMSIALKEANETAYWIELLEQSHSVSKSITSIVDDLLTEILKMLVSSVNTAKGNGLRRG
jgi:four helix bundle protein